MRYAMSALLRVGLLTVLGLPFAEAAGPETPEALVEGWVHAWNAHDMKALASSTLRTRTSSKQWASYPRIGPK